ncbi:hypothetical protein Tsubulata_043216 [Turnera subulata]|uniref:DC1 domain-containing protein n=1 Tax=Turnera subulata TaxID=218843 RepID=A0A9Q0FQ82_9ROSI|nr:hypothetical protein Tsubulata_043216 [Turnera subulata]
MATLIRRQELRGGIVGLMMVFPDCGRREKIVLRVSGEARGGSYGRQWAMRSDGSDGKRQWFCSLTPIGFEVARSGEQRPIRGKMEAAEQPNILYHFSHQHPLEYCTISTSTGNATTCYGCSLEIVPGKDYYSCKTCLFSLHPVCSSMPRKAQHPAHPNRHLTLTVSPPSDLNKNLSCGVCQQPISGFYYNVVGCSIYYHILCSSLPLSVTIPSHPHPLKIQFSPPYDFRCDLCEEPSYRGWLYRCRFCEFDAHTACAIFNQIAHGMPLTDGKMDHGSESNDQLMQLMAQRAMSGIGERNDHQEIVSGTTVTGWDERLRSPKEDLQIKGPLTDQLMGLKRTKPYMPSSFGNTGEQSRDYYPSITMSSDQDLTIPSYQFSDLCFSIDLLNSYPSNQGTKEDDVKAIVPQAAAQGNIHLDIVAMPKGYDPRDPRQVQAKLNLTNKAISNPLFVRPENLPEPAFSARNEGQRMPIGFEARTGIKEPATTQQDTVSFDPFSFISFQVYGKFKVPSLVEGPYLLLQPKL